ncbi:MAG: carboxylesterase family protein [Actinomycetota bacterium]
MAVTAAAAVVLLWLNHSPWWGWTLSTTALVAVALVTRRLRERPMIVRAGTWVVGTAITCAVAVLAYPPASTRVAGGDDPVPTEQVSTQQGPVQGVLNDERTVEIFAGIPYAHPPIGDLRWQAPAPADDRDGVFVADAFSAVPVQGESTFVTRALSRVVDTPLEGTLLNPYRVSEDSLSLNIWRSSTPTSDPLPVLVYIPGGGFATGSGTLPLYDGEALASRGDVITVTINYRLGVLGFLSHPDLADETEQDASGNYGILDQIAALEWVRDNIASFGGDPERVTVAGESAGGESVCILGATPLSEGLLDGLIAGSGACMGTAGATEDGDQFDTRAAAEAAGMALSERLGGATIEEMRAMPVERLRDAAADLAGHWRPSIDGHVLPAPPADIYAAGDQHDVPLLVGSNADEASLALALPPDVDVDEYRTSALETYGDLTEQYLRLYPGDTRDQVVDSTLRAQTDSVMTRAMFRWAQLQTESGEADAYLYFFSHTPPEAGLERYGAYHGAEVAYACDNLGVDHDARYTDADYRLRDQMSGYWSAFARTGSPNGDGAPVWSTMGSAPDAVMEFTASGGEMTMRPRPEAIDFWMEYEGPIRWPATCVERHQDRYVKRSWYLARMTNVRERIITKAEPVFDQHGFAGTGVDRLTETVGVSSRTLYKHLGSKAGLVAAVLDTRRDRFFRSFDVTSVDDLFSRLIDWVNAEGARGCLFLRAMGEDGDAQPDVAAIVAEYRAQLYHLVRRLVLADTGREDLPLTEQVLVLFEGATSTASYRGVASVAAARAAAALLIARAATPPSDHEPRTDT